MRVLWISECPWMATGFGKSTYYYSKHLMEEGIDVINVCFATFTKMKYAGLEVYPYGNPLEALVRYIERRHGFVDAILLFGAPWIPPLASILDQIPIMNIRYPKTIIGFFVHEGIAVSENIQKYYKKVSYVLTPTDYIAKVVGIKRYGVVPHGVNPQIWRPIDKPKPRHIIGMIAKNHPRKRWDLFFMALAKLAKKHDFYILPYTSSQGYWNIPNIINVASRLENDIKKRVINLENYDIMVGLEETQQSQLVSGLTIHTLISAGEAFGIPILETLSMGIPNLVIEHPAIMEWCGNYCNYVKRQGITLSNDVMVLYNPDLNDVVDKLEDMIVNYDSYREKALSASEKLRKTYSWENVTRQLINKISRALKYTTPIEGLPNMMTPKVIE